MFYVLLQICPTIMRKSKQFFYARHWAVTCIFLQTCKFSNVQTQNKHKNEWKAAKKIQQTWSSWVEFKFLPLRTRLIPCCCLLFHSLTEFEFAGAIGETKKIYCDVGKYFSSQSLFFLFCCLYCRFISTANKWVRSVSWHRGIFFWWIKAATNDFHPLPLDITKT